MKMQAQTKNKKRRGPPPPPTEELMENPADDGMDEGEKPPENEIDTNDDNKQNATEGDNDETGLGNLAQKPQKKRKKGIIYVSNIPKHMNVTRIREILGEYGKIGRVYLQPERVPGAVKKKKRNPFFRHFTEGWIEFESKRVAKQIAAVLNTKQISTRKRSQFYDYIWTMKYLPRFKWVHLTERMNYEQAIHKQRLMNEVSQARKETTFFQNNLDKSEHLKKKAKWDKKDSVVGD